jgi:hypothetical protein
LGSFDLYTNRLNPWISQTRLNSDSQPETRHFQAARQMVAVRRASVNRLAKVAARFVPHSFARGVEYSGNYPAESAVQTWPKLMVERVAPRNQKVSLESRFRRDYTRLTRRREANCLKDRFVWPLWI